MLASKRVPCPSFVLFALAFSVAWFSISPALANAPSGRLFVAATSFPTNAEDSAEFIRKGQKHHQKSLSISGDELSFHFLLVLKSRLKAPEVYFVLFKQGGKEHVSATSVALKKATEILTSPLSFPADAVNKGSTYELRAIWARVKGKQKLETILAKTTFTIR